MADLQRVGHAHWTGDLKSGSGKTSTGSGVLRDVPYSVPSRFQNEKGTNPEELIASAHASCFSMMLAKILGDGGKSGLDIVTKATLTLGQRDGGWKITGVQIETEVSGQGLDDASLQQAASQAKDQCPVSQLLKPGLETLSAQARLRSGR